MHILYKALLVGFFIVTLASQGCKKSFLDSYPVNNLSAGNFYKTEDDFTNAVNGIYDALQADRSLSFFPMVDVATPFSVGGGGRFTVYNNGIYGVTAGWNMAETFWISWYQVVFRANVVLDHIDAANLDLDQAVHDRLKGEALFLRSLAYFYLSSLYGDVPLILQEQAYEDVLVPRTPKAEVEAQIIADLQAAEKLLPSVTEYRQQKKLLGRASRGAAQSLLGKVYLYDKKWEAAASEFHKVIEGGDYKLEPVYSDLFWPDHENGEESIFEIQYQSGVGEGNSFVRFCAPSTASNISYAGFNYINPTESYADVFGTIHGYTVSSQFVSREPDASAFRYHFSHSSSDPLFDQLHPYTNRDPRLAWTLWYENTPYIQEFQRRTGQSGVNYRPGYSTESGHNTVKYIVGKLDPSGGDSPGNLIIIRYADVLLMYAEALIEENQTTEAAVYINRVRQRPSVHMPTLQQVELVRGEAIISSQDKMRAFLHNERYRELGFEFGHMYMDMVRWDVFADEMVKYWTANKNGNENPALGSFTKDHYLWPIPAEELNRNPNLVQNAGY